jgi:hypothetical protein
MKKEKRSPLRVAPLRYPGQSIAERRRELVADRVLQPMIYPAIFVLIAGLEYLRELMPREPHPLLFLWIGVLALAIAVVRIVRVWPELEALRLARDGELVVGQALEALRAHGYQVIHDVVADGFNIDHVLIGPSGVYTVETKTYSKGPGSEVKVLFDGETVLVDGIQPDRNPVVQARAQANWIRQLLAASTGQTYPVRPVVLFPGWWTERAKGVKSDVWVLNEKAFPEWLKNERTVLDSGKVGMASLHLAQYVRSLAPA